MSETSGTCPAFSAKRDYSSPPLLEMNGISKHFADKEVVRSATLSLRRGEVLCLSGPSGIGKSTLLEVMAGAARPDYGKGYITRRAQASLMFQDDALLPWLNARDNITYILPPRLPERTARATARRWLGRFGLEEGLYPAAMSGGMRRRLSLARAFAAGREFILLDEPFAFLDGEWQAVIAEEIETHARAGAALALTSHDRSPFVRVCSREIVIERSPVVIE
ncbi:MAG: ATP-binding cassette domain-containing protein [Deltaproteobacteria bacterium]|jgi:NitT/TauT family transport system ATP-binding protein|nr:ATP-binding cassette domain-containing protein [Deltaproteobacteria bacterium]